MRSSAIESQQRSARSTRSKHTGGDAPFREFWHLQDVLQHGQCSEKKLVRVKVMGRKLPGAYSLGHESFSVTINLELAKDIRVSKTIKSMRGSWYQLWIDRLANGVRVADAVHQTRNHDLSEVGIRTFFINANPRKLPVPFLEYEACCLTRNFLVCAVCVNGQALDSVDPEWTR